MSIKPQANFYNLKRAADRLNFPFTAQVLPTMLINEFQSNLHHKVTFLSKETLKQRVHIQQRNDQKTKLPLDDIYVKYVQIDVENKYQKIGEVLRNRRTDDIRFLTVMSRCVYKDTVLDIGDVLYLQPQPKFLNKNSLKCIAMPGNRKLNLPDTLFIELQKCSDVRNAKREKLFDLLFSGKLPCMITFMKDFEGFDSNGYSLAKETVLLTGHSTCEILLACKENQSNNQTDFHTFPSGMDIDIEILHGDTPVAEFTEDQIRSIMKCIKEDGNLETEHMKFTMDEVRLDLFDYESEFSDDDDDPYENTEDCGYEYPDVAKVLASRQQADKSETSVDRSYALDKVQNDVPEKHAELLEINKLKFEESKYENYIGYTGYIDLTNNGVEIDGNISAEITGYVSRSDGDGECENTKVLGYLRMPDEDCVRKSDEFESKTQSKLNKDLPIILKDEGTFNEFDNSLKYANCIDGPIKGGDTSNKRRSFNNALQNYLVKAVEGKNLQNRKKFDSRDENKRHSIASPKDYIVMTSCEEKISQQDSIVHDTSSIRSEIKRRSIASPKAYIQTSSQEEKVFGHEILGDSRYTKIKDEDDSELKSHVNIKCVRDYVDMRDTDTLFNTNNGEYDKEVNVIDGNEDIAPELPVKTKKYPKML